MAGSRLRCRSEDWLRKFIRFFKSRGQLDPANFATLFVFLPARSGKISAHYAFDRKHVAAHDDHGSSPQLLSILLHIGRVVIDVGSDYVMWNDVFQKIKPEQRNLGQHTPLMGNTCGQHVIEGRDSIGSYKQQVFVIESVNIADFSAGIQFQFGKVGLQQNVVDDLGAHEEILQVENVAYSRPPKFFVNSRVTAAVSCTNPIAAKKLTRNLAPENRRPAQGLEDSSVEKLREHERKLTDREVTHN